MGEKENKIIIPFVIGFRLRDKKKIKIKFPRFFA
jgi:hypothetical protein